MARHPVLEFGTQPDSGRFKLSPIPCWGRGGKPQQPALEFSTVVDLGFSTPSQANLSPKTRLSRPRPSSVYGDQTRAWAQFLSLGSAIA